MRKAERIAVLFTLGMDYHSGMSSRGYRLQCRAWRWLRKNEALQFTALVHLNTRQRMLLADLATKYGAAL
jgi:hypothetical protein